MEYEEQIRDIMFTSLQYHSAMLPEESWTRFDEIVSEAMQEMERIGLSSDKRLIICAIDAALRNAVERKWPGYSL